MRNIQLAGMSYEQASRHGLKLVQKAAETHNWFTVLDDLVELREIMQRKLVDGSAD